VPIQDFEKLAQRAQNSFFNKKKIPDDVKDAVKRYLFCYEAGHPRKVIFFQKFAKFCENLEGLKDLEDRNRINEIFYNYRQKYSVATYHSLVAVTLQFATWLNDGVRPKAFQDVKRPPKGKTNRDLKPEDMVTWEDGLRMASFTHSIQLKAIILTQLDGGFRPGEFVDLQFEDVVLQKGVAVVYVRSGKTGKRVVILKRSVEALRAWMEAHPLKNPKSSLWIAEYPGNRPDSKDRIRPYRYAAIQKRVKNLALFANIRKPADFYNLRHSSCVLDKLDNLPVDLAAERHGHSVRHYTEVYGRLSTEDVVNRYLRHYGQADPSKKTGEIESSMG
jgi:integrase